MPIAAQVPKRVNHCLCRSRDPIMNSPLMSKLIEMVKPWLGKLALVGGSLLATFLILEFLVFGLVMKPDDVLENLTVNQVVRYAPDTHATFRHPDGRETLVTINSAGWNSTKEHYEIEKQPGRTRIAIVGDSYVHGAFINVDEGFPNKLEQNLKTDGYNVEVYRFGMDGAPLSQYLHMLRREVSIYKPDVVVIPIIHNDLDESYRFLKTRYASSFMKLKNDEHGKPVEVTPADFRSSTADLLRRSATFRYLYYETGLYLKLKSFVSKYFWGGQEEYKPEFISSAVDIRKIKDHEKNRHFARYILSEMKRLSKEQRFKLFLVMDAVREAIYDGKKASDYEVGKLNAIMAELTDKLELPFKDLQQTFAKDYAANKERFEFSYDWHWNKRANDLVADEIARMLKNEPETLAHEKKAANVIILNAKQ